MKQTTTKLGVLAFLGLGVMAFGQTENYDGKVGINTEKPSATLEVKPSSTNANGTTNEGIIAPKLSKQRLAKTENPKEGTLVYVDNTDFTSIDTTKDTRVADITEKGYYFYNGAKWVKTAGGGSTTSGSNEQFWAQNGNKTYLVPAKQNERDVVISNKGYLGIGTDNPQVDLSIVGKPDGNAEISLTRYTDNGNGANLTLSKAYGTPDTPKVPPVGSNLSRFRSSGYIGGNNWDGFASSISTNVAGAPVNGALPTDMVFVVTNDQGNRNTLLKLQGNSGLGVGFPTTQDIKARLQVNDWYDVTLASTNNAFMIGKETGVNLVMDSNEIMARNNGATNGLSLQAQGGDVIINGEDADVTKRFYFRSDTGNIGLGTGSPTEKLEVVGSIKSTALAESGGGNRPVYADASGKLVIGSASMSGNFYGSNGSLTSNRNVNLAEYDLTFTSNNNSKKGKVGIGTNRPVSKLHVESDDDTQYAAFFTRNPNAGVNVVHGKEQGIGIFNNALGNYLISRSPVANAKPFIFDVRTEENLTSPTSGSLYYNFKIQNKEVASLSNEGLKLKSLAEENGGKRPVYADSDGKLVIGTAVSGSGSDHLYTTDGRVKNSLIVGEDSKQGSLEVKGTAKVKTLPPGSNTDKVVVADGEGNLKQRSLSELKRANLRIVTGSTTLNSNDEGGYVYVNSTSAVTVTVPISLPAGFSCVIVQKGTGQVSVAGSGVTLETAKGKKTRAKHSAIGVIKDTVSSATITGDAVM